MIIWLYFTVARCTHSLYICMFIPEAQLCSVFLHIIIVFPNFTHFISIHRWHNDRVSNTFCNKTHQIRSSLGVGPRDKIFSGVCYPVCTSLGFLWEQLPITLHKDWCLRISSETMNANQQVAWLGRRPCNISERWCTVQIKTKKINYSIMLMFRLGNTEIRIQMNPACNTATSSQQPAKQYDPHMQMLL